MSIATERKYSFLQKSKRKSAPMSIPTSPGYPNRPDQPSFPPDDCHFLQAMKDMTSTAFCHPARRWTISRRSCSTPASCAHAQQFQDCGLVTLLCIIFPSWPATQFQVPREGVQLYTTMMLMLRSFGVLMLIPLFVIYRNMGLVERTCH